jgi:DNA-binding XRE family transcriptional regulator
MSTLARIEDYPPGEHGLPHMGAVIADHRIKAGWTSQETFAIACGVDKQTVVYWENQAYIADMNRRIFLCKMLKIPPVLLGLTWASLHDEENTNSFPDVFRGIGELLEENAYALYEDMLTFAHTSRDKYSPVAAYRFYKHQQELEEIVKRVPTIEKDAWQDLLSRFYQHSTFIAQHHKRDKEALSFADKAISLAEPLHDDELLGAALYRRSRVHLIQRRHISARNDITSALEKAKRACAPFKGSSYLLAAEINALYAGSEEKLKTACRTWQDQAAKLTHNGKIEDDGSFLTFNLYAVHHERAETLLRFAFFHTNDKKLVEQLKDTHEIANKELLRDARNALTAARKHVEVGSMRKEMYLSLTEACIFLGAREYEESAKEAKIALQFARASHSQQGIGEVKQLYTMLFQLAPKNPYIANLGVELGIFPLFAAPWRGGN